MDTRFFKRIVFIEGRYQVIMGGGEKCGGEDKSHLFLNFVGYIQFKRPMTMSPVEISCVTLIKHAGF